MKKQLWLTGLNHNKVDVDMKNFSSVYQRAPFPVVMTGISIVLFVFLNLLIRIMGLEPFYRYGLLAGILVLSFGMISVFTVSGRVSRSVSTKLSVATLLIFVFFSWGYLVCVAWDEATPSTTDVKDYEKALGFIGYPGNPAANQFPEKIPDNAQEVQFSYHPAIGQGGEVLSLKYKVDSNTIASAMRVSSKNAKWIGAPKSSEAKSMGVYDEFSELPSDLTIYLRYSRPYRLNDWNHGKVGLTAISPKQNEILFLFEQW